MIISIRNNRSTMKTPRRSDLYLSRFHHCRWDNLNLSLLGKIAAIKMNVLPRFMFLFQALPIIKKISVLDEWQKAINKFVWAGKKPRIEAKCLCDRKER